MACRTALARCVLEGAIHPSSFEFTPNCDMMLEMHCVDCTACAHSNAYCPISYYYRAARSSASGLSSRQRGSVHLQSQRCFALAGQKPVDGVAAEWITYPNEREGADYW
jgi:hypothetical protein